MVFHEGFTVLTWVLHDQGRRLVKEDGVRAEHKLVEGFEAVGIAMVHYFRTVA